MIGENECVKECSPRMLVCAWRSFHKKFIELNLEVKMHG
jgi:hypothetical protein